jgi:hypothetical protein
VDDQGHRDVGRDPLSSDRAADDEADGARRRRRRSSRRRRGRRRRSVVESEGERGEVERQVENGEERGWAGSSHVPPPPPTVWLCFAAASRFF